MPVNAKLTHWIICRNPILVSYIAKGILPYRGTGSGIKRPLEAWPKLDFIDDRDGCLFTAIVERREIIDGSPKSSSKSGVKTENQILDLIRQDNTITTLHLSSHLGISKRAVLKQIEKLKKQGRLLRIGSSKGGHWEVK